MNAKQKHYLYVFKHRNTFVSSFLTCVNFSCHKINNNKKKNILTSVWLSHCKNV